MPPTDLSKEWTTLCRAQRKAYFAWQNATAGTKEHDKALAAYDEISKKQSKFYEAIAAIYKNPNRC